ncbi:MAG: DUF1207 domain-containing protein [Pirellulales bacterium]|nr:DUF1207 domain-containing protein [Pirellulales bacterium]
MIQLPPVQAAAKACRVTAQITLRWSAGIFSVAAYLLMTAAAVGQITPLPSVIESNPPAWGSSLSPLNGASEIEETMPPSVWSPPPAGVGPKLPKCEDCTDEWHWQVLPHNLIYQSYMAGMKEPRLASFWNNDPKIGTMWDIALGGRAGLWRYGNDNPDWPEGWELDIEGAVFPRLDPLGESTPLLASDYRFGIPLTYGRGNWQFKLGYYHISSHLGDEFVLSVDPDRGAGRINFVRDGIVFGAGYFFTPAFRLYGEVGYSPAASGGAEPLEFQFGFDWMQARNTGMRGGPFLATNADLRQEVDFGGNFVVQAGWMWRQYVRGPIFRIGAQYFYGNDDQFEFFQRTTSRIGWGIWYDF